MSSALLSRLAFRQSRLVIQRRAQSSASGTAEATKEAVSERASQAKESASQVASKAQQGLSRVTTSAGNVVGSAANAAGNAVSRIGGRTGRAIKFIQGLGPPTLYYARVGGELMKIIYRGRNMQPPTVETVQGYLSPVAHAIRNPSTLSAASQNVGLNAQQSALGRVRNMDTDTLMGIAIVTAEVVGFFCIGEMIGRFKIVGYRGGHSEHH